MAQPIFMATESLFSGRKQTRTKDNEVDLLVKTLGHPFNFCLTTV